MGLLISVVSLCVVAIVCAIVAAIVAFVLIGEFMDSRKRAAFLRQTGGCILFIVIAGLFLNGLAILAGARR